MIEDLLLFGFSNVGVVVLGIKLALPEIDLCILLLDQLYEVLILLHEMGVLSQQQLDLFLEVVDLLTFTDLEQKLLVYSYQLGFQLSHPMPPLRTITRKVWGRIARR